MKIWHNNMSVRIQKLSQYMPWTEVAVIVLKLTN